jgi:hypothetical protein
VWDADTGLPVSVPFIAPKREPLSVPPSAVQPPSSLDVATVLAFSPDGRRLLAHEQADSRPLRLWPSGEPAPAWLPDLAEKLARVRLDDTGSAVFTRGEKSKSLAELKRLVAAEKDPSLPLVVWARRLLGLEPATAAENPSWRRGGIRTP